MVFVVLVLLLFQLLSVFLSYSYQVGLIGEALPALGALVRALARVHAAVSDQVGLVAEALTTAGTLERAVDGVPARPKSSL